MADLLVDNWIQFTATDSGTVLTPTSNYANVPVSFSVADNNNDGNIDSGDTLTSVLAYTGYTINIGGNPYAIFKNAGSDYFVPYSSAIEDLSGLNSTPVTQPISLTGDDAFVYNCFLTGTLIDTPHGPREIQTLDVGDKVLTDDGRALPLRWVARQKVRPLARNLPLDRRPVRISAGALGEGLPTADLHVSADHGVVIDGLLINAGALVNGSTIRELRADELPETFTYWHIELDEHAAILANGVPSESFVDYAGRSGFDNYDVYLKVNGCDRIIPEMALPRISAQRHLPHPLRQKLGISDAA